MLGSDDNADVRQCAFKSMVFKVKDTSYIVITKKTAHNLLGIDSMHMPWFLFCSLHVQGTSLIVVV